MATSVRLARLVTRRAAIDRFLTSPAGPVWRDCLRRGIKVQNLARTYVRVDTGTLRASIGVWQKVDGQKIITGVGSNVEYAPNVGTIAGPHGNCKRCWGAYLTDALDQVTRGQVTREFNRDRTGPVQFAMDGDIFDAVPEIPAGMMVDLIKKVATAEADPADRFNQLLEVLRDVLTPDSRSLFERRLSDPGNPIGLRQLTELTHWLLGEVYGGRPTSSPSPSPVSPGDGGTPSTDGAQNVASTLSNWPGAAI